MRLEQTRPLVLQDMGIPKSFNLAPDSVKALTGPEPLINRLVLIGNNLAPVQEGLQMTGSGVIKPISLLISLAMSA